MRYCIFKSIFDPKQYFKKEVQTFLSTSYSLFNDFIEKNFMQIADNFNYLNKNYEKFSYIFIQIIRNNVILDIKDIYYLIFLEIEKYIFEIKLSDLIQ